jgi:hypothetical protein
MRDGQFTKRRSSTRHPETVAAFRIDMNLRGDPLRFQLGKVRGHRYRRIIIGGDHQKRGRRVLWDRQVFRPNSRISKHRKIRTGTKAVDRIGRLGLHGIKLGFSQGGDLSASRESHNPDATRLNVPLRCPASDHPDRPLRIRQGMTFNRIF